MLNFAFNEAIVISNETVDTIKKYCRILGDFKTRFTPPQKYAEEKNLNFYAKGFTTSAVPVMVGEEIYAVDLNLNFYEHKLKIFCGDARLSVSLKDQSIFSFAEEVLTIINGLGIICECDFERYADRSVLPYSESEVGKFWDIIRQIYFLLLKIKGELPEISTPLQLRIETANIDMIVIPDISIDEKAQINLGFSLTGPYFQKPHFYVAIPNFSDSQFAAKLPRGIIINTDEFKGAVYNFDEIVNEESPDLFVSEFFHGVFNELRL